MLSALPALLALSVAATPATQCRVVVDIDSDAGGWKYLSITVKESESTQPRPSARVLHAGRLTLFRGATATRISHVVAAADGACRAATDTDAPQAFAYAPSGECGALLRDPWMTGSASHGPLNGVGGGFVTVIDSRGDIAATKGLPAGVQRVMNDGSTADEFERARHYTGFVGGGQATSDGIPSQMGGVTVHGHDGLVVTGRGRLNAATQPPEPVSATWTGPCGDIELATGDGSGRPIELLLNPLDGTANLLAVRPGGVLRAAQTYEYANSATPTRTSGMWWPMTRAAPRLINLEPDNRTRWVPLRVLLSDAAGVRAGPLIRIVR